MILTYRRSLIMVAGLGSLAALASAFGFQYLGGLLPCVMCLWQRWPHAAAIALGALGVAMPSALLAWLGALTMLGNAGLAFFHTGIERSWWEGPQTCAQSAAQDLSSLSADALLDTSAGPQLVMCNQVAWEFLGLSMASWNGVMCLVLAGLWIAAARVRRGS